MEKYELNVEVRNETKFHINSLKHIGWTDKFCNSPHLMKIINSEVLVYD
jgi:hypothetical protein